MPETPVSLCVLLWARPGAEEALGAYEDSVLALLPDHGARVVERGSPTEVQLLEFPSAAAMDAYMKDPRRTALAADRDAAIARTEVLPLSSQ
jgi:uncharacterized protein (DUF1330 family)